jgi:small-conductance mechanosensitive channel
MRARLLALVLVWVGLGVAASAQSPDARRVRADLEHQERRAREIGSALDAGALSDGELASVLEEMLGYREDLDHDAEVLKAALEGPAQSLEDLGPAPGEGQPPESTDIARLRRRLSEEVSRWRGLSTKVELIGAAMDRLIERGHRVQTARFRSALTTRNISPFSSRLWTAAAADVAHALDGLVRYPADWWRRQRESGRTTADLALLLVALAGAIALLALPRGRRWRRLEAAADDDPSPSRLDRRRRVAGRVVSRGLLALGAGGLLLGAALETGLVFEAGRDLASRLWLGGAMLIVAWNFADGLFAPRRPEWRVAPCPPASSRRLRTVLFAVFGLFVADRVLGAGFELAGAGTELTLAQGALGNVLFAALLWLLSSPKLWRPDGASAGVVAAPPPGDAGGDPVETTSAGPLDALCSGGRLLSVLILVATALAYIRFANFAFHRAVLLAAFLIVMWCAGVVAGWGLGRLSFMRPAPSGPPASSDDASTEDVGFWLRLVVGLTLLVLGLPVVLMIVGFDAIDLRRWFDLLDVSIRIGAVSFSLTDVLTAVAVFLLVSVGTRWTAAAVDKHLLQRSPLDAGERDSIRTLINYTGTIVAAVAALAVVGVGLTRVAVVAGALSVGIGFGLQSIVANFVSGLILLFERPIRMGDWVVLPSGEGYVKHIGARATEIQTFDRATVLVPNSELVSSAVQNWFLHGRRGRVRVDVGVAYGSDPDAVQEILLDCARQHPGVVSLPKPEALWMEFGESSLDFQLRAFVRDYDDAFVIMSDLRFAIFKALKAAGIRIPFPQRDVHLDPAAVAAAGEEGPKDPSKEERT